MAFMIAQGSCQRRSKPRLFLGNKIPKSRMLGKMPSPFLQEQIKGFRMRGQNQLLASAFNF